MTKRTPTLDADAARQHLLDAHADLIATALDCAAAVAANFEDAVNGSPATRDSRVVRSDLRTALDRAGVLDEFAGALPDVVDAAGGTMRASPVPAPPHLAVTSGGPVARATLGDRRLVVRVDVYTAIDGAFVWRDPSPDAAVSVAIRK